MIKRILKIIGLVILLSVFVFSAVISPFAVSFLPSKLDESFDVSINEEVQVDLRLNKKTTLNLDSVKAEWFNYYAIFYRSDSFLKGELCYKIGLKEKTEEFFLEPTDENGTVFY